MGIVYRVHDRVWERDVALKTLRNLSNLSLKQRTQFKSEFRSLADVTHTNLLELFDLVVEGGNTFFTMELIDGVDFRTWIRGEIPPRTSEETLKTLSLHKVSTTQGPTLIHQDMGRTRTGPPQSPPTPVLLAPSAPPMRHFDAEVLARIKAALRQLTGGLMALHQKDMMHLDIKPTNILVDRHEGRVVLLDFGLVRRLKPLDMDAKEPHGFNGTPAYMSPEQICNAELTGASDWYSVGSMLYETFCGRLPFEGSSIQQIHCKSERSIPAPLNILCPDLPAALCQLTMHLLDPFPERRAGQGEVLQWLEQGGEAPQARPALVRADETRITGELAKAASWGTTSLTDWTGIFVGRQDELEVLNKAMARLRRGIPSSLCIHGRSGMGKSELVRHFLDGVGRSDTLVLQGRCHPREAIAFKAFDGIVDALLRHLIRLSDAALSALQPADVLALTRVFPAFKALSAFLRALRQAPPLTGTPQEIQRRGFAALRELLKRLSVQRQIVLWIDDLQWGDLDSIRLLHVLLQPPASPVVLMLLSYRSEEKRHNPVLKALFEYNGVNWFKDLEIRALDLPQSRALVEGFARHLQIPERLDNLSNILDQAEGNPFWLRELTQALALRSPEQGAHGMTLEDVVHWRVSQLTPEARLLLELVSVSGQTLTQTLLGQIDGVGTTGIWQVERLRKRYILRTSAVAGDTLIETYHDKIREAVLARLTDQRLTERHHQLADMLLGQPEADLRALVHHLEGSGRPKDAGTWAVKAARQASETLAFELSVEMYRKALALNDALDQRVPLEEALGEALINCGKGFEAAAAFERAIEHLGANQHQSQHARSLQQRAAEQYLRSGHPSEGSALMADVLEAVGVKLPRTPAGTTLAFIYQRGRLGLRGLDFELRDTRDIPEGALRRLDVCWSASTSYSMIDPLLSHSLVVRCLRDALDLGERSRIVWALGLEASFQASLGGQARNRKTEALLDQVKGLAAQSDAPYDRAWALMSEGTSAYMWVQWRRCIQALEKSIQIMRAACTGVAWEISTCQSFINTACARMGQLSVVREKLPRLIQDAKDRGDLLGELGLPLGIPSMVFLADNDSDRVREIADDAIARWTGHGTQMPHYLHILATVQADLYDRNGASAWKRCGEPLARLKTAGFLRLESPRVELWHLKARAALAHAMDPPSSEGPTPEKLLATARKLALKIRREATPWATPMADAIDAGLASMGEDPQAAADALEACASGFDAIDMPLHAHAARHWLGTLIEGDGGRALIDAAAHWMADQGIEDPQAMAFTLVPGFGGPTPSGSSGS